MKVLTVSATDRIGGAGIAAYRLHHALSRCGIEAEMLVWRKVTAEPKVHRLAAQFNRWQRARRRLAERRHRQQLSNNPRQAGGEYWSLNLSQYPIASVINAYDADVVHLHWIGDNFLPIQQLARIKAPIVWTLHDMWAFTGGCHYARDCERYIVACGDCPQLVKPALDDISARVNAAKRRAWTETSMTIVCPSNWLADCAAQSAVLRDKRIEVIANPIDHSAFKPIDKAAARKTFNLPLNKKLILFGAAGGTGDPRKGFTYLRQALQSLPASSDIELVVFGARQKEDLSVNLPLHQVGALVDSVSLSLLYSACDVYVLPASHENLPNTLMEALSCGTPCVAFATGGVSDLVNHQQNGYLAKLKDAVDLLRGIQWTLEQDWSPQRIHREMIDKCGWQQIGEQTIRLYQSLAAGG